MYPISLLSKDINIFPIFGNQTKGSPAHLDYSTNARFLSINARSQDEIEGYNKEAMLGQGLSWILGGYLEDRSHLLTGTHIRNEGRVFHLGVDIVLPAGRKLYSPFNGEIYEKGYETGDGNYGGYVIIKYCLDNSCFYVLYGHLSCDSITDKETISVGEPFAILGKRNENGNWFEHLHLQVFTGKDLEKWKSKGYCYANDLPTIRNYCPDPMFILRF